MIYSVYDWGSGKYRVFRDALSYPMMSDPKSCAPVYRHAIGVDVNAALCAVPSNAQFVGWSDVAQGQVSRTGAPVGSVSGGGRSNGPDLGALGFLGQATDRPLSFSEAIVASTVISIVSGLASAWFFRNVRVPK